MTIDPDGIVLLDGAVERLRVRKGDLTHRHAHTFLAAGYMDFSRIGKRKYCRGVNFRSDIEEFRIGIHVALLKEDARSALF